MMHLSFIFFLFDPDSLFECDFETSFCSITQESVFDDFDWQITSGETPTAFTGPGQAVSGDMYAYIEATGHSPASMAR